MSNILKHIQHFTKVFFEDFNSSLVNYLTLWTIVYSFITSTIATNIQKTWLCYIYQISLIISYFLSRFPPEYFVRCKDFLKIIHGFLLTLELPIHFVSTTELIKVVHSSMYDKQILSMDSFLIPHFELGQLALNLDSSLLLNPTTILGMASNDFFELVYISFYVWGFFSYFYCCYTILYEWYREHKGIVEKENNPMKKKRYIEMEYFLLCWATTCSVTFVINSFVPGKSPRIFLKSDYSNEITGFGFSGWWRSHVDRDDSSGTFPSGHFGGTFAVALGMFYSNKYIGSFVFLMSILIGLSTLWNRYHYFSDLFVGMLCALFGYFVANLHLLKSKNKY